MPQADCTARLKSTSLGSRYSRPMPLNSARQVSSVSASTVATKSRRSSWPRGDVDGEGACCVVGGLVGASPWRMTRGSKPKKRASSRRTTVPMPPPATSGPPKPRRSSMLSLCLPPKRTVHLPGNARSLLQSPGRGPLLDQARGPHRDRRRNRDVEQLCGPDVDHELEVRRLHDRQVSRLRAVEQ